MWKIILLILLLLGINGFNATNYTFIGDGMHFFNTCDEKDALGMVGLDDLTDYNLVDEYADDMETIITNGNITVKVDLDPKTRIKFKAEIYKWQRGSWVNTIFSLYRPDLCASLFKPTEIWYSFIVQLPKEDRKCPPEKGHVYYLKNLSNRMEVYNLRIAGDYSGKYKSIMHYTFDNTTLCVSFEFNAWKS